MAMTEFIFIEQDAPEEEYTPPPYGKPGRILVEVYDLGGEFEYEILDYDGDSGVFWIQEGEGFDWWIKGHLDLPGEGRYLISDISGDYIRGDGWTTDDDVDWYIGLVTRTELDTLV
ncbi:MAG: hypothetical protein EOQ56_28060 [Mesorhizobium sp.]|nr:MAG: hypothetical protein EOQ56_28060 [Mesorhizobium sp.]